MPEVTVSRFVAASPDAVADLLTPGAILEHEGHFVPKEVEVDGDRTAVTVHPSGRLTAPRYVFEERDDGVVYRRDGGGRQLLLLETRIRLTPSGAGTRIDLRSTVDLRLPIPLVGRFAAWRRRRTLERLSEGLARTLA